MSGLLGHRVSARWKVWSAGICVGAAACADPTLTIVPPDEDEVGFFASFSNAGVLFRGALWTGGRLQLEAQEEGTVVYSKILRSRLVGATGFRLTDTELDQLLIEPKDVALAAGCGRCLVPGSQAAALSPGDVCPLPGPLQAQALDGSAVSPDTLAALGESIRVRREGVCACPLTKFSGGARGAEVCPVWPTEAPVHPSLVAVDGYGDAIGFGRGFFFLAPVGEPPKTYPVTVPLRRADAIIPIPGQRTFLVTGSGNRNEVTYPVFLIDAVTGGISELDPLENIEPFGTVPLDEGGIYMLGRGRRGREPTGPAISRCRLEAGRLDCQAEAVQSAECAIPVSERFEGIYRESGGKLIAVSARNDVFFRSPEGIWECRGGRTATIEGQRYDLEDHLAGGTAGDRLVVRALTRDLSGNLMQVIATSTVTATGSLEFLGAWLDPMEYGLMEVGDQVVLGATGESPWLWVDAQGSVHFEGPPFGRRSDGTDLFEAPRAGLSRFGTEPGGRAVVLEADGTLSTAERSEGPYVPVHSRQGAQLSPIQPLAPLEESVVAFPDASKPLTIEGIGASCFGVRVLELGVAGWTEGMRPMLAMQVPGEDRLSLVTQRESGGYQFWSMSFTDVVEGPATQLPSLPVSGVAISSARWVLVLSNGQIFEVTDQEARQIPVRFDDPSTVAIERETPHEVQRVASKLPVVWLGGEGILGRIVVTEAPLEVEGWWLDRVSAGVLAAAAERSTAPIVQALSAQCPDDVLTGVVENFVADEDPLVGAYRVGARCGGMSMCMVDGFNRTAGRTSDEGIKAFVGDSADPVVILERSSVFAGGSPGGVLPFEVVGSAAGSGHLGVVSGGAGRLAVLLAK